MRIIRVFVLSALVLELLVACSGASNDETGGEAAPSSTPAASASPAGALPSEVPPTELSAVAQPTATPTGAKTTREPTERNPAEVLNPPGYPTPDARGIIHMSPDEIDASYRADELLTRTSAAMDYLTTGHLTVETRVSSSGSVITSVSEVWIAPEMTLMRQQSFGITVESLARADGLCFRQSGLDWMRRKLPSPNPLSPQALLGEMLDGDYGELVRLPDLQDDSGENLFRIWAVSASAVEAAELFPSSGATTDEVPQAERTIVIVIERATFYPRSAYIESRVTLQGTSFEEIVSITFDRLGLPTLFPEDLPLSCSIFTS